MNKAKETNANPSIKKVFGDLLDDLRDSLERKFVDYELEIRLKQVIACICSKYLIKNRVKIQISTWIVSRKMKRKKRET